MHWSLRLAWLSWALLLVLLTLETLVLPGPGRDPNPVVWGALVTPLLLCLPALWSRSPRGLVWLSLIALFYFTRGVIDCFVPGRQLWGGVEVALATALYSFTLYYIRWGRRVSAAHRG